jgi:hypothetical protein
MRKCDDIRPALCDSRSTHKNQVSSQCLRLPGFPLASGRLLAVKYQISHHKHLFYGCHDFSQSLNRWLHLICSGFKPAFSGCIGGTVVLVETKTAVSVIAQVRSSTAPYQCGYNKISIPLTQACLACSDLILVGTPRQPKRQNQRLPSTRDQAFFAFKLVFGEYDTRTGRLTLGVVKRHRVQMFDRVRSYSSKHHGLVSSGGHFSL